MIVFCQSCDTEPLDLTPGGHSMLMVNYRPLCPACLRNRGHGFAIRCDIGARTALPTTNPEA